MIDKDILLPARAFNIECDVNDVDDIAAELERRGLFRRVYSTVTLIPRTTPARCILDMIRTEVTK
jgi:hypothetical protein